MFVKMRKQNISFVFVKIDLRLVGNEEVLYACDNFAVMLQYDIVHYCVSCQPFGMFKFEPNIENMKWMDIQFFFLSIG